jgi:hypothetical protein
MKGVNQPTQATYFPSPNGTGYSIKSNVSRKSRVGFIDEEIRHQDPISTNPMGCTLKSFHCPNCSATIPPAEILVNMGTTTYDNGHFGAQRSSEWANSSDRTGFHHPSPDSHDRTSMTYNGVGLASPFSASGGSLNSWAAADNANQLDGTVIQAGALDNPRGPFSAANTAPRNKTPMLPISESDGTDSNDGISAGSTPQQGSGDHGKAGTQPAPKSAHKYAPPP